jgi:hypothetical protein
MKQRLIALCAFAILWSSISPVICAQTAKTAKAVGNPFVYDVADEVTVNGAVSAVLTKAPAGTINGSHLFVTTLSGPIDVSLGAVAMTGKDPIPLRLGQSVEVTGVMMTRNTGKVFIARVIRIGERVYPVRTRQGVTIPSQARERLNKSAAQNGGSL